MGTPAFMAPELLDRNVFSEKSDVYSFAIVLWEIWHGGVPWRGLQPMQIMRKVVDKGERPPVPAGMPSKLRELMVRAWSGDPGGRPPFQEIVSEVRIVRVAPLAPAPARSGFASWFGAAPPTAQDVELLATGASVVAGGAAIVVDEPSCIVKSFRLPA
jgi:serine/threonine protein kinase